MDSIQLPVTLARIGHTYRHFKGGDYVVKHIVRDSDRPKSEVVVYQEANGPLGWVRSREEFEGLHETGVPRFTHVAAPSRLSWAAYFIEVAHLVARRATCDRRHVGAVFVRDMRIVTTGYNGSVAGLDHCDDVGHDLVTTDGRENCVRTVHAEQNGIYQAALIGVSLARTDLYVNTYPCWNCAKALIAVRVARVVYDADYNNDPRVTDALMHAGIEMEKYVR